MSGLENKTFEKSRIWPVRDFSRGGKGGISPPENGFAPPGLCLNVSVDRCT